MADTIQHWPPQLLRAVTTSFTPGWLNLSAQPLFQAAQSVFAEPLDSRWAVTFQSPPLQGREIVLNGRLVAPSYHEVIGRVAALKGMQGKLRLHDPLYVRPQYDSARIPTGADWSGGRKWSDGRQWANGLLPTSVTVDAVAYAGATSIVLRGLPASLDRVLRIGDRFEAEPNGIKSTFGNYYILTNDARTNADGKVRVYFQPGLRVGLNIGDKITLRKPTSVFTCIDDKQGVVNRNGNLGAFGMSLIEVLPLDT